ncbi:MAG: SEC-C domain-containing protein [Candidatus Solibacter usitatus]|nr:SEC-C domain-containing protein [Candidatus Solibacter usitatus]
MASMLYQSDEVFEGQKKLLEEVEAGTISAEEGVVRLLELDGEDYYALFKLGMLKVEAGAVEEGEALLWRSAEANPAFGMAFGALSKVAAETHPEVDLSLGLMELAIRRMMTGGELPVEFMADMEMASGWQDLSPRERMEVMQRFLLKRRDIESLGTTERLRPHRLVHSVLDGDDLDKERVDAILGEGDFMIRLLLGVLRAWARGGLEEEDSTAVECALALLGEMGDARLLGELLEMTSAEEPDVQGPAQWAMDRILGRMPEAGYARLRELAAGMDMDDRATVVGMMARRPPGKLALPVLEEMAGDWSRLDQKQRDGLALMLVLIAVALDRRAGRELGRNILRRHGQELSKRMRRDCEQVVEELSQTQLPLPPVEAFEMTVYDICAGEVDWCEDEAIEDPYDDDDDDEYLPPEPVRRTATPSRNDPCWCGSGKKYKKCHLDADVEGTRQPSGSADDLNRLRNSLGDFVREVIPLRVKSAAMVEFGTKDKLDEDEATALIDWLVHDFVAPHLGRTVIEEYVARHGSRLSAREREMAGLWAKSHIGLYEAQSVTTGKGVDLKDLVFGGTQFVHDVSLSKSLVKWDVLLGRVVPGERGQELTGLGVKVQREDVESLKEWMEAERRARRLEWAEFLKREWPLIRRQPYELAEARYEKLRLTNTDGEDVVICEAKYAVVDRGAVEKALRGCGQMEEDGEGGRFAWLSGKAGETGRTVLGSIRLDEGELSLDSNSRERFERGKQLLERLAGEALRHKQDESTTQAEMKRRAREEPAKRERAAGEIPKEVQDRLVTEHLERHYAEWPDTRLPALDGKTPREAVKTKGGRSRVVELLRDFENGMERRRLEGEPHYDVGKLRRELGLE